MGTFAASGDDAGRTSDSRGAVRRTARDSGLSFAGAVVSGLAGFALSLALGRTLGPTGSGIVFQMISAFTIAGAVARFGLDTTAVWLLPKLRSDATGRVRRAVGILLLGSLATGIVTALALWAVVPVIAPASEQLRTLLSVATLFLPVFSVMTVALAVARGMGRIREYVLIGSVGLPVTRLAAVSVGAAFSASAVVAGSLWLAALPLAAVAAIFAVARLVRGYPRETTPHTRELLRTVSGYSGPRVIAATIEQALLWLDVLIVGILAGPAAAGIYGVVSRLVQAGTIPSTSMRVVVAPQFSGLLHRGERAALAELYGRSAQWIVLMSIPAYVVLSILGTPFLALFGPGFASGTTALAIMCVGATVWACTGNVQALLLMSGRTGWAAINKVIALTVSLTLLFTLVPLWGIVGAAVAWTVTMSLDAVLALIQVTRGTGVRLDFRGIGAALVVGGLAAAVPSAAARIFLGDSALALVVGLMASVACWAAALYVTRRRFALNVATEIFTRRSKKKKEGGR